MKNYLKMTLATLTGLLIFGFVSIFIFISVIGAVATFGDQPAVMPAKAYLSIDMSTMVLSEQTTESDPLSSIQTGEIITPLGIYSAINAINAAAVDPAIQFIYIKPDGMSGGISHLEEFRKAIENFRNSGKAVVAYTENPSNGGYYLASVSDKVYMTPHAGGLNMFNGISTQMIFLKDILDRIGVNVQLIRHGKYKSAGEMYIRNSASKENMEQNKAMVESMWDSWAGEIAQSRNISVEELNAILNGLKLDLPSDWVEYGLVDELLTRNQLEEKVCDLFVTDNFRNVKGISIQDYAEIRTKNNLKAKNKVAVIYADGNIVDGEDEQQVAGTRFARMISDIRKDTTIKAAVLRVNSPGGSVLASEKIKAEIDLLQERIPVIASYGNYAASGGYWISACCDKIYSDATTLTGSIGVFSMIPDISKTLNDKLHVNITPVNSNSHSDMYSSLRPLSTSELAYMQASVENIYSRFVKIVSEGRDMTPERVDELAQGRVWTGAEALEIGLVDEIGTIEDAIRYAAMSIDGVSSIDDIQLVEVPKPMTPMEMLLMSLENPEPTIFSATPLKDIEEAFRTYNTSEIGKVYARIPYEIITK